MHKPSTPEPPPKPQNYHVVSRDDSTKTLQSRTLAQALAKDGQLILPMLDLLETAQCAVDELIDVMGRARIEAVLLMSTAEVAGPRQQGRKTDREVVYHGSQQGRVKLKDRQLQVPKPRLRRRKSAEGQPGEVEFRPTPRSIPVATDLAARLLQTLIGGVSTRRYANVITEMPDTLGMSRSLFPWKTIKARAELLKAMGKKSSRSSNRPGEWINDIQRGQWHFLGPVRVFTTVLYGFQ